MDETDHARSDETKPTPRVPSACPQCSSPGRVVTAVTIKTLGTKPRTVLVTYRCLAPTCQFKYPILKTDSELTEEERALWR